MLTACCPIDYSNKIELNRPEARPKGSTSTDGYYYSTPCIVGPNNN